MGENNKKPVDQNDDPRLVDGDPTAGVVPLGELAKTVDRMKKEKEMVEEAERRGYRW